MPYLADDEHVSVCDLSTPDARVRRYLERLSDPRPMPHALERMFVNDVVRYSVRNGISGERTQTAPQDFEILFSAHCLAAACRVITAQNRTTGSTVRMAATLHHSSVGLRKTAKLSLLQRNLVYRNQTGFIPTKPSSTKPFQI